MPCFLIDQWVDARSLGRDTALRAVGDAVRGLAAGQVAEVIVNDVAVAAELMAWLETKPMDVLESSILRDSRRLIIRHR